MTQKLSAVLLLWTTASGLAFAGGQADSARVQRLEARLLAPCCYQEPVSTHQSEIALKMRLEIAKWVEQGLPDDEILGQYVSRYGNKILIDPATRPKHWNYVVP